MVLHAGLSNLQLPNPTTAFVGLWAIPISFLSSRALDALNSLHSFRPGCSNPAHSSLRFEPSPRRFACFARFASFARFEPFALIARLAPLRSHRLAPLRSHRLAPLRSHRSHRSHRLADPYPFCGGFTKQLSVADNKAFAVSFSGYILATGLILWSSLANMKVAKTPELDVQTQAENIGNVVMWQFIGILLLEVARILNDNLLLRGMDNCVEVRESERPSVRERGQGAGGGVKRGRDNRGLECCRAQWTCVGPTPGGAFCSVVVA